MVQGRCIKVYLLFRIGHRKRLLLKKEIICTLHFFLLYFQLFQYTIEMNALYDDLTYFFIGYCNRFLSEFDGKSGIRKYVTFPT